MRDVRLPGGLGWRNVLSRVVVDAAYAPGLTGECFAPVQGAEVAVDAHSRCQAGPGLVQVPNHAVDAKAQLVGIVGGAEKGAVGAVGVKLGN